MPAVQSVQQKHPRSRQITRELAFNSWTGRGGVNRSDGLVHVLIEPAPVAALHVPAVQSVEKNRANAAHQSLSNFGADF